MEAVARVTTTTRPARANRKGDSQAMPTEGQQHVAVQVMRDVENQGLIGERTALATRINTDIHKRIEIGIRRYGHPLQTFNGRDARIDAWEESLDLANYLCQLTLEQPHNAKARVLYWNALALVFGLAELMNNITDPDETKGRQ